MRGNSSSAHSAKEQDRLDFRSLIKRDDVGTYHNVSGKYLTPYVAEFQFRHNNRGNDDVFGEAIEEY
jgi:ISXO2-like transposase domain